MMADTYTLTPTDGGTPIELTPAQYDRFFDNRDPCGWKVQPPALQCSAPGFLANGFLAPSRAETVYLRCWHAIRGLCHHG